MDSPVSPRNDGPPLWHHLRNVVYALGYLMFLSAIVAMATERNYWATLAAFTLVAVTLSVLLMFYLAQQIVDESGLRRFSLTAIFLVIIAVAVYLALLRWLISSPAMGVRNQIFAWIVAAIATVPGVAISAPFFMLLSESLIWTAVKIVRLPFVQRWLRERRRRRARSSAAASPVE
jgi:hypothetical protein